MVTRERAQLVLVGAIAIGIVLLALTTVLNSAVFTENVAGGQSVEVTGDVKEFDREAVRNVRSIEIRINHGDVYRDNGAGRDALEDHTVNNVSNYSAVLAESYADTGSVYVNLSSGGVSSYGSRIVQQEDANFSKGTGSPSTTWTPVDDPFELGWFVMNLDVENVSRTTPLYVNVTNASGVDLTVSVRRTPGNDIRINSSIDGSHRSKATCDAENGRVLLDVVEGSSSSGDCEFNSTEYLEGPYAELRFENGQSARGKYDVVVNDSSNLPGVPNSCGAGASPVRPCEATAAWSIEITTHYHTASIDYEMTRDVSVYGG